MRNCDINVMSKLTTFTLKWDSKTYWKTPSCQDKKGLLKHVTNTSLDSWASTEEYVNKISARFIN